MSHFYRDLPDGHIRVLTIHPGNETTPLSGVLRSVPLASAPDFEAVSYAWGNEDFTDTLDVVFSTESTSGGKELTGRIPITPNVTSLLRSLRYRNEPRVLWIDAICINQTNVSERSAQVQQMRQIYSCAQRVIIWLGLATEDGESDHAFRFLRRMGTYKKRHEPRDYMNYVPDEVSEFSDDGSLSLSDLERVSDVDGANCDEEDEGSQSSFPASPSDESDLESAGLLEHEEQTWDSSSKSLQGDPLALGNPECKSDIEAGHSHDKEGEFSGLFVIASDDESKPLSATTEPHEPIVLTFAPLASLGFKAYRDQESMSFSEQLRVRWKQNQAVIGDSPYFGGSMDFARVFGHGYAACADEKAVAWFGNDLTTLHTHAVLIDEISSWCGIPQGSGPIEVESVIDNACAIAHHALQGATQYWWMEDEREKNEVREQLVGQLWGNETGEYESQAREIALQVIIEKVLCAGSAAASTVAQVVQNVMPLRRFFVTKGERYLGIGPASARPGDKVFVIAGCNFPLILREIADENGDGTGEFELVGESYVHGIMAGEAISRMKETAWWEGVVRWLFPKTVKWTKIVIR
ncbi:hypothetical protein CkaCkLH20_13288 [Colletotrichum karsti]|uniref:Heterokaryon incompatibility domain-containing protein n=1 Tax=Colletotrichum karsti TaxID=1095194 RepID=A0A9P6HRT6_9PEZI|nr:uncharacterized protein CkaCkLH20_13288 [Colletotrichum karsti]KAF9869243.1 hypothetical protein CkaCkLH20_13288 [Colletotrichum karsti]